MTTSLLLTGATGFIGHHLYHTLAQNGVTARCAVRRPVDHLPDTVQVGDIDGTISWQQPLEGIDVVIHLAARAHIMQEESDDPMEAYRRVNTWGTVKLAEDMIAHGCRRLVFVSTIGVNGDTTPIDQPFTESSPPDPQQPYARAKWEAEQRLHALRDDLEIVIVRPPLVYGPHAPGNFGRLVKWVKRGVPLPFGAISNRRSLVALHNLCDFLVHCTDVPEAAGETFLVCDDEALSTTALLRSVGEALDQPVRLIPLPESILRASLRAVGRGDTAKKLLDSLVVDNSKARELLGWQPPLRIEQALAQL